jgi:hypothetical protein
MKIIKFFSLIIFLELSGCKWITTATTPVLMFSNVKVPDGSPAFQKGFRAGCETTLYSRGNVWFRTRYKYNYDPKMIGNPEYRFGHSRGYSACFHAIVGANQSSFDRYIAPGTPAGGGFGYGVFDTKAVDIGGAWGGFFGDSGIQNIFNMSEGGMNGNFTLLSGGGGKGALSDNPLWAGGSSGQFFGQ